MNVTLIGMPGSGKSAVGRLLAQRLGYAFLDVDRLIEARQGAPLQTILDRLGNQRFLELEARVVSQLDRDRTVIAPGGSAVLREKAARHLKSLGPVIYLCPPCAVLERRLGNLSTRGVTLEPGQTIRDLYNYRAPLYEKYADATVDSNQPRIQDTVELVLAALERL